MCIRDSRWTTGSLQGLQTYGSTLFREMILRRSVVCLDMYLTFLTPFVQLAGAVLGLVGTILLLMGKGFVIGSIFFNGVVAALILTLGGMLLSCLGTAAAATVTVLLKKENLHGMGSVSYTHLRYVSKEENACAPAHSFCIMPKKLTI